jgi:hypothetical protein
MMRKMVMVMAVAMAASLSAVAAVQNASTTQEQPVTTAAAAVSGGLSDLEGLVRGCPKAGLNAAARRAASVPSQGKYQFSYFNIISDSHHALYEVHFTSNYEGESVLKYCVEIYCQQGWDPKDVKTSITVMSNAPQRTAVDGHAAGCAAMHMPANRRTKR